MLVVNPHHWLDRNGCPPTDNLRIRRQVLRVARLIEYGGTLRPGEFRETLVECARRPGGKSCLGLLWVTKTSGDDILAYCVACETDQVLIHSWQDTDWARGPMEAVTPRFRRFDPRTRERLPN